MQKDGEGLQDRTEVKEKEGTEEKIVRSPVMKRRREGGGRGREKREEREV